jgi:hypothetical protein
LRWGEDLNEILYPGREYRGNIKEIQNLFRAQKRKETNERPEGGRMKGVEKMRIHVNIEHGG